VLSAMAACVASVVASERGGAVRCRCANDDMSFSDSSGWPFRLCLCVQPLFAVPPPPPPFLGVHVCNCRRRESRRRHSWRRAQLSATLRRRTRRVGECRRHGCRRRRGTGRAAGHRLRGAAVSRAARWLDTRNRRSKLPTIAAAEAAPVGGRRRGAGVGGGAGDGRPPRGGGRPRRRRGRGAPADGPPLSPRTRRRGARRGAAHRRRAPAPRVAPPRSKRGRL